MNDNFKFILINNYFKCKWILPVAKYIYVKYKYCDFENKEWVQGPSGLIIRKPWDWFCCCSVVKSHLTLQPHGLQHARLLCLPLSQSFLKFMSIVSDSIYPSHPLPFSSSFVFHLPQHQGLFNESTLQIRWPKY